MKEWSIGGSRPVYVTQSSDWPAQPRLNQGVWVIQGATDQTITPPVCA